MVHERELTVYNLELGTVEKIIKAYLKERGVEFPTLETIKFEKGLKLDRSSVDSFSISRIREDLSVTDTCGYLKKCYFSAEGKNYGGKVYVIIRSCEPNTDRLSMPLNYLRGVYYYFNGECKIKSFVDDLVELLKNIDRDVGQGDLYRLRQWLGRGFVSEKMDKLEAEAQKISDEKKREEALKAIKKMRKSAGWFV
jgi:hypothetical protein